MNLETHNKYFRDIDYNTDASIVWPPTATTAAAASTAATPGTAAAGSGMQIYSSAPELVAVAQAAATPEVLYMQAHRVADQYRIEQLVKQCQHVTSGAGLMKYAMPGAGGNG
jgi:hypothetical protein